MLHTLGDTAPARAVLADHALSAFAVLVLALGWGLPLKSGNSDACDGKLPAALSGALLEKFAGHALPRLSDNLAEDIRYNREHGGDGCLGIASDDYNGDGRRDHAVLLKSPKQDETLLVAALATEQGWHFDQLRTWGGERYRLYVATAAPGTYQRSESFDYPISEPGEVESHSSLLKGIVTGRTEASGIYYFWTARGWVHVWAID